MSSYEQPKVETKKNVFHLQKQKLNNNMEYVELKQFK